MSGSERSGICCSGNWIIDHVKTIDTWPGEEQLSNILDEERATGGSPTNVSIDLARFDVGMKISGLGLVGEDTNGRFVLSECERFGIDSTLIRATSEAPTAYTDVMNVRDSGRRTFFHQRGANALLGPSDYRYEEIDARILSLGYLLLLDGLDAEDSEFGTCAARVLAGARAAGLKTAVDVVSEASDRFRRIVTPALPHIDYLIVNEIEAGNTLEVDLRPGGTLDRDAVERAAASLVASGVNELVVIHTPEAAYAARSGGGESVWSPTLELPSDFIVGAAGAGDAFFAGMLLGIHEEWSLEASLRFANGAAASCLRHPTCSGGVGSAAEIEELCARFPLRSLS